MAGWRESRWRWAATRWRCGGARATSTGRDWVSLEVQVDEDGADFFLRVHFLEGELNNMALDGITGSGDRPLMWHPWARIVGSGIDAEEPGQSAHPPPDPHRPGGPRPQRCGRGALGTRTATTWCAVRSPALCEFETTGSLWTRYDRWGAGTELEEGPSDGLLSADGVLQTGEVTGLRDLPRHLPRLRAGGGLLPHHAALLVQRDRLSPPRSRRERGQRSLQDGLSRTPPVIPM